MSGTITVALGGRYFAVRPLTLRQLRDVGIMVAGAADLPAEPGARERRAYDQMVEVVSVALRRDSPDMTADAIYDLEIGLAELQAAHRAILRHSGLVASGEPAAASSDGAMSTDF
jgi:hypothetical protein